MRRQTDLRERPDQPFARIPVIPSDAVAVIRRKAMMIIMVAFAVREQCGKPMVAPAHMVIVVRATKRVRKGVNEKRDVKNHDHAQGNREHRGSHWMSNGPSG